MESVGDGPRRRSQVTPRTVWVVAVNLLLFAAVLTVLRHVSAIVGWVLIALLLALALDPAVRFLERRGAGRRLAVAVCMLAAIGTVVLLFATVIPMLLDQGRQLVMAAPDLLERLRSTEMAQGLDERFDLLARAKQAVMARTGQASAALFMIVGGVLRSLAATVTVLALTAFMLLFGGEVFRTALSWVRPADRARYVSLAERVRHSVGNYTLGTLVIASVGAVVVAVTLLLLGVPYFLPIGLVMLLLGVVPFVGALLGGLLMVVTALASAGFKAALIALGVFLVYQQAENHLLQPLVQRRTIRMNPLLIALALLVGTSFAGVLGALLALPLAAAIQIVLGDVLERRRMLWGERPEAPALRDEEASPPAHPPRPSGQPA